MDLFSPISVKGVTFKNRVMFPPLTTGYEERDGSIGQRSLNFYRRIAEGGAGYIVLGDVGPINTLSPTPKLFHDGQIESFRRLADAVHGFGAKLGLQLFHPEYDVEGIAELFKKGDMAAARARLHHDMEHYVQEVTAEQLAAILDKYAACTKRAVAAGADVIQIHGDRLVGALCSTVLNRRTDSYGGSFENRVRFALQVVQTLKDAAPGLLIEYKLPIITDIPGTAAKRGKAGLNIEEGVKLARVLEAAGVDMIHVGQANHTANVGDTIPAMGIQPYGFFEKHARQVKAAVSIPVSTVGRILSPDYAQAMLDRGSCDMIGLGRPLLTDPDWVNKAQAGKASQIRQCIMCNKGCTDALQSGKFLTCVLNAENGYEYEKTITPAKEPKRVVVVGAGPAGLEAARVARVKGHSVVLFEKATRLGGQLNIASVPPRKNEVLRAIHYLSNEVSRLGVDLRLGEAPTSDEILALSPDNVIIATGAENRILPVEGAGAKNVLNAWKVLSDEETCGGVAVVLGGGLVGAETAELLAARGCKVAIVEMLDAIAKDESPTIRPTLLEELERLGVDTYVEHTITRITPNAVFCKNKADEEVEIPCDFAVMAVGAVPVPFDTAALDAAHVPYVFVGDAMERASDIKNAINTAYDAANAI